MERRSKISFATSTRSFGPSHQVVYTTHSPFMIDVENVFFPSFSPKTLW